MIIQVWAVEKQELSLRLQTFPSKPQDYVYDLHRNSAWSPLGLPKESVVILLYLTLRGQRYSFSLPYLELEHGIPI